LVGEVEKREKKYREIVDFLQRLIDVAPVAVTAWDTEFRITLWNKAAEALFGWKADEAVGKDLFELQVPEKERSRVRSVIEEVMRTGVSKTNVNENFTKDGRKLLVEWYNFAIRDADGRIVGGGSIGIDLTKRIEMERKLRESEEKFRKIVENSPNLIFIVDRGGVFVDANPATIQFFGFSPVGRNLEDVLPGDAKKRVNLVRQVVDNEKTFTVRDTVNGKHFEASFIPIELSDGRYCLVIAKDITEILRLNRLLSVIKNVDMIIVREKNKRKLLQKACKELSSVEDYATVTILLVEAKKIRPVAISGVKRNFESVFLKTLQDCEVVRKCVDGEVLAGEVEELCPKCEFAREFRRVMAFPMIVNGDVKGAVVIHLSREKEIEGEEIELLKTMAEDLAFGIKAIELDKLRRRAYKQIEHNIEQFAILVDHIRNPLAAIYSLAELRVRDPDVAERIIEQVRRIDEIIGRLDKGWLESEEIRKFLKKYG
jgi:PAS domain S-box-containing protein